LCPKTWIFLGDSNKKINFTETKNSIDVTVLERMVFVTNKIKPNEGAMISILMTFSSNASWSNSLFSKFHFKAKTPSHGPKYGTRTKVDSQLEMQILLNRDDSTEKVNKNLNKKLKKRAIVSNFSC
jgi:hypothetical protein